MIKQRIRHAVWRAKLRAFYLRNPITKHHNRRNYALFAWTFIRFLFVQVPVTWGRR